VIELELEVSLTFRDYSNVRIISKKKIKMKKEALLGVTL
jgi:hypothetical protein